MKNNTVFSYEVYNKSIDKEDDSRRGSAAFDFDKEASTNNSDDIKINEMAKMWYAMVDEDERLCISGITTYKWIDDESIAATHQLLLPCNSDLKTILKKDTIIENRERKLKVTYITNLLKFILYYTKNTIKLNHISDQKFIRHRNYFLTFSLTYVLTKVIVKCF